MKLVVIDRPVIRVKVGESPSRVYSYLTRAQINQFITETSLMRSNNEHFDEIPIRIEVA